MKHHRRYSSQDEDVEETVLSPVMQQKTPMHEYLKILDDSKDTKMLHVSDKEAQSISIVGEQELLSNNASSVEQKMSRLTKIKIAI